MSNGAQMSSLLACRLPDRITAVAPVAGVEFSTVRRVDRSRDRAFHDGRSDRDLRRWGLERHRHRRRAVLEGPAPSGLPVHHGIDEAMTAWAAHNRCDPEPVEQQVSPSVRLRTWQNCAADTMLYIIEGGGHAWPGKPVPPSRPVRSGTTEIDASTFSSTSSPVNRRVQRAARMSRLRARPPVGPWSRVVPSTSSVSGISSNESRRPIAVWISTGADQLEDAGMRFLSFASRGPVEAERAPDAERVVT